MKTSRTVDCKYIVSLSQSLKKDEKNLPSLDFVNLIITLPFCSDFGDNFCVLLT